MTFYFLFFLKELALSCKYLKLAAVEGQRRPGSRGRFPRATFRSYIPGALESVWLAHVSLLMSAVTCIPGPVGNINNNTRI